MEELWACAIGKEPNERVGEVASPGMDVAEIGPPIEPPIPTLPGDMERLTAEAAADAPEIGTAPGAGGEARGALLLFWPKPDEPVGLVPPVLPMTKEPGGELDAPMPPILLPDGDIMPKEPGDMTPLGVPLPPLPAPDPTCGDGDA